MDTQLEGTAASAAADQRPSADLQRALRSSGRPYHPRQGFIPVEVKTEAGTIVFRTSDREVYMRAEDGSIHRVTKKVNGKLARKMRRNARD